jgi:large subunit ribosomal protein L25
MAEIVLQAEPRSILGKKVARLRRSGLTPANIYGHNVPSQAIQLNTPDLAHTLRAAGGTHLVQLHLTGEPAPRMVLVRRVSRKPTTDQLLHVDFYEVSMTEKATVEVPIVLTGSAPILETADGFVDQHIASLTVDCLPADIPDHIEADLSRLVDLHSSIKVGDLKLPPGSSTSVDPGEIVVGISGVSLEEEAAAPAAEGEAAAAEQPEEA